MICRIISKIKDFFSGIKWFIQRGRRGYSDWDLWCFWDYLCDIIPPAMRWYIENGSSCPDKFFDEGYTDNECWKWDLILENIAQGFEAIRELDDKFDAPNGVQKELTYKFEKGMKLLTIVFRNLWD